MTHDPDHDLHRLTGAYALHALPEGEREAFEAHLPGCGACADEVAELQATAARLADLVRDTPSPALRHQVLEAIDRTRQDPPAPPVTAHDPAGVRPAVAAGDRAHRGAGAGDHADDDGRADDGVRRATLAEVARTPQEPPATPPAAEAGDELAERRARRGVPGWVVGTVGAVAGLALIAVLGVSALLTGLDDRLADLEVATGRIGEQVAATDRVTAVLAAPDAQVHDVSGPDGATARVVVSPTRGEAVFLASGMEPAPHAHAYELWVIGEEGPVPAGLFDADDRGRAAHVLTGDLAGAQAIGVTVEPESGSPEPTTDPIMVAEF
jgi:anti-sigma-K factor RskA